ncbi:hypothetical protein EYF80_061401 [Liparis tanakae]|uniref:Uncharacterized protein n=1 Tax=Liparis tanakae TaxID=230148 RepID=A0A4Z2EIQ8_9TELE|nr:hypothetical protein EYF80_061401 [Liparis tanakae]
MPNTRSHAFIMSCSTYSPATDSVRRISRKPSAAAAHAASSVLGVLGVLGSPFLLTAPAAPESLPSPSGCVSLCVGSGSNSLSLTSTAPSPLLPPKTSALETLYLTLCLTKCFSLCSAESVPSSSSSCPVVWFVFWISGGSAGGPSVKLWFRMSRDPLMSVVLLLGCVIVSSLSFPSSPLTAALIRLRWPLSFVRLFTLDSGSASIAAVS